MNTAMTALLSPLELDENLPAGFNTTGEAKVSSDGTPIVITRAQRADGVNAHLGGEHISQTHTLEGKLLGHVHMTSDMAQPATLPDKETAHSIAMEVLSHHAPDLLDNHTVHWIDQHHETIEIVENDQRKTLTLTGMKVKMRATTEDQLWFWVIVGPNNQVMVFERDIYWITMPGHRRTEKWLHDEWLAQYPDVVAELGANTK